MTDVLSWNDVVPFGKYKGSKVRFMVNEHTSYAHWAYTNKVMRFDADTVNQIFYHLEFNDSYLRKEYENDDWEGIF